MPSTPNYINDGIPYLTSKNIKNGKILFDDINYISENDYNNISKNRSIEKGDLLITMIGTIGECAFVDGNTKFYGQNMYLVRLNENEINRKYFYYYFIMSKNTLISKKNTSNQGYLKAESIQNLKIPIPPIEIQEKIVEILDQFYELTNELKSGLPGEIRLRKKQYEYYRNLLLTFDVVNYESESVADAEQGTRNKEQGTRNKEQGTRKF